MWALHVCTYSTGSIRSAYVELVSKFNAIFDQFLPCTQSVRKLYGKRDKKTKIGLRVKVKGFRPLLPVHVI